MSETSTLAPEKNYLSATRFAHSVECGMRGWVLSNPTAYGITKYAPAYKRGLTVHKEVEDYLYGEGIIGPTIPHSLLEKLPQKTKLLPVKEYNTVVTLPDGTTLSCIGTPDIITEDLVIELKTGQDYEWHKWQLAFYMWITGKQHGKLIYADKDLEIELNQQGQYAVTEETVIKVWNNILSRKEVKCEECSNCPVKKTCSLWVGKTPEKVMQYIDIRNRLQELEDERDVIKKVMLVNLEKEIASLETELEKVKKELLRESDTSVYDIGRYSVSIHYATKKVLPEGFTVPSYSERPDLYNDPTLKRSNLLKEYGVDKKEKTIVVRNKKGYME